MAICSWSANEINSRPNGAQGDLLKPKLILIRGEAWTGKTTCREQASAHLASHRV